MAAVELIVFQVIVLFWSLIAAESQVMMTRPGCDSYCGNISIPYPFGMKEGCYLDESFKILCTSSSQAPKLTVNGNHLEVRYISVPRSMIRVMFPIVFENCGDRDRNTVFDLEGSPFVFSSENYFIATGCGYFATMTQNQSIIGGCVPICDEKSYMGCSGINCCQTRIPSFLKGFNVNMIPLLSLKGSIDQTHVTTLVQGTFGYLDPEYFQSSQFTDKSDVYSFGVVLVELLTGQKAISFTRSEEQGRSLATYFIMAMESNCLFDILDPQVVKQGEREEVLMVASLARSCLRLNGKERPTMKEVTMVLDRLKKSENLIVQQENEYDRNEVMGAPWDVTSASTISSFDIGAPSSLDEKPLLHTY